MGWCAPPPPVKISLTPLSYCIAQLRLSCVLVHLVCLCKRTTFYVPWAKTEKHSKCEGFFCFVLFFKFFIFNYNCVPFLPILLPHPSRTLLPPPPPPFPAIQILIILVMKMDWTYHYNCLILELCEYLRWLLKAKYWELRKERNILFSHINSKEWNTSHI